MPSLCGSAYFYPRPPRGGRPSLAFSLLCNREISIHALREEGDGCSIDLGHIVDVFLSTPSARRATISALLIYSSLVFLSTPSARRATGRACCFQPASSYFYPRPLRGGRRFRPCSYTAPWYFYPRPLRGGRRAKAAIEDADEIFLSTPSARRATHELDHGQRAQVISIHALCEEGDVDRADVPEGVVISIHALCEEGDSALL